LLREALNDPYGVTTNVGKERLGKGLEKGVSASAVQGAAVDTRDAEYSTRCDLPPKITPELAGLIDAWAGLPEPVRCGILAMVEAAKGASR